MAKLKKKIKSFTIIETMVSMIILITSFILTFMCVMSIKGSFRNDIRRNAYFICKEYIQKPDTIEPGLSIVSYPGFTIAIKKAFLHEGENLSLITISALASDSTELCILNEIILEKPDNTDR